MIVGALGSRQLPGGIALWPAALVPTWFGISHLVASVTGYSGCPELGAIPSVMLARPVATGCGPWESRCRRRRCLVIYGLLVAQQPSNDVGRVLAAYGGVFVIGSMFWAVVFDGFKPDRFDLVGAIVCLMGIGVIMYAPR